MSVIKQAIEAEAQKYGYSLDKIDLRCGLFFLKKGDEVLSIGSIGRILPLSMVRSYVELTVKHGRRIDQIEGSRYFVAAK